MPDITLSDWIRQKDHLERMIKDQEAIIQETEDQITKLQTELYSLGDHLSDQLAEREDLKEMLQEAINKLGTFTDQ